MSDASDYHENAIMNVLFGKASAYGSLSSPPTIYVAMCTAPPVDSDTGSSIPEATYTSYARVATTPADWNAAVGGVITNNSPLVFPKATGGAETLTHFAICDAAVGGNMICKGALSVGIPVVTGVTPQFDGGTPGSLSVTQT